MTESGESLRQVLERAGRRAGFHLLRALIETVKAVEAVIEEVGATPTDGDNQGQRDVQRIEIE